MGAVLERLPDRREIAYAYGGVIFLIYTWALRGFFLQVPSLILYHPLGEVFAILTYMLAFAMLESLAVMAALLLLAMVLPRPWFAEGFGYKAFLATLISAAAAVALETYLTENQELSLLPLAGAVLGLILVFGSIFLFERHAGLQRLLVGLLDRIGIFTYLYLPIGVLSLFVVLIRILW